MSGVKPDPRGGDSYSRVQSQADFWTQTGRNFTPWRRESWTRVAGP